MKRTYIFLILALSFNLSYGQNGELSWVMLDPAETSGTCISNTNCESNVFYFGLLYTPAINGTVISYTTGFFFDCVGSNDATMLTNISCVMTDKSTIDNNCLDDYKFFNSSANSGDLVVTAGQPVFLHYVSFLVTETQTLVITEDEFTDLTLAIQVSETMAVPDFPTFERYEFSPGTSCDVTPVTLLSFDVKKQHEEVILDWVTSSEQNSDYFDVQHSQDGVKFQSIGVIKAAGNSNDLNQYQFVHEKPIYGKNYYRLQQIDFDQTSNFTEIREVDFFGSQNDAFLVLPNPTRSYLNVYHKNLEKCDDCNLFMYNALGELVKTIPLANNRLIDVANLSGGLYHLVAFNKNKSKIGETKFIKIE